MGEKQRILRKYFVKWAWIYLQRLQDWIFLHSRVEMIVRSFLKKYPKVKSLLKRRLSSPPPFSSPSEEDTNEFSQEFRKRIYARRTLELSKKKLNRMSLHEKYFP